MVWLLERLCARPWQLCVNGARPESLWRFRSARLKHAGNSKTKWMRQFAPLPRNTFRPSGNITMISPKRLIRKSESFLPGRPGKRKPDLVASELGSFSGAARPIHLELAYPAGVIARFGRFRRSGWLSRNRSRNRRYRARPRRDAAERCDPHSKPGTLVRQTQTLGHGYGRFDR